MIAKSYPYCPWRDFCNASNKCHDWSFGTELSSAAQDVPPLTALPTGSNSWSLQGRLCQCSNLSASHPHHSLSMKALTDPSGSALARGLHTRKLPGRAEPCPLPAASAHGRQLPSALWMCPTAPPGTGLPLGTQSTPAPAARVGCWNTASLRTITDRIVNMCTPVWQPARRLMTADDVGHSAE